MRAEDILPNEQDQVERGGVVIRKGSVGAFLANAAVWGDAAADAAHRQAAEHDIIQALPALRALGLFQVFAIRDPALRRLVDAH
ncbi:hypothetical protein [Bordetella petrii]|uniref:hypothetical protein n=1 Tax=Bordetella petrii TaxID=94624 RepID=UPI001E282BD4|nr:hypothetical protein [Bordetella petrii]MCD0503463.1 hypothetical protein [Bordetella petrii]